MSQRCFDKLDGMPDPVDLFVINDIRKMTDASLVQLVNEDRLHRTVRAGRR